MTILSRAQVFVHGVAHLLDRQALRLTHEVFQIAQRQIIEAHRAKLADDIGIAGGGQREAAGQFAFGVVEFFLGRAGFQIVGE